MRSRGAVLYLCLLLGLPLLATAAGVYRWVDAEGNVVYGDDPPKSAQAETVDLPALTIADSFVPATPSTRQDAPAQPDEEQAAYTRFKVTAPAVDEAIRANDGNMGVTVAVEPALRAGDSISLYLDGKQVGNGKSLTFALTEVDRGEHTVFAVLADAQGNIIQNTEAVRFNVLRHSVLQTP